MLITFHSEVRFKHLLDGAQRLLVDAMNAQMQRLDDKNLTGRGSLDTGYEGLDDATSGEGR